MRSHILLLTALAVVYPALAYRVVLDPGHGGRDIVPHTLYGDKFDRRLGVYLDKFREGARARGVWEFEAMYDIAAKAKAILDKTATEEGRAQFKKILRKYGKPEAEIQHIEAFLSRQAGYPEKYFENRDESCKDAIRGGTKTCASMRDDLNAPFRLYDYPNQKTGAIEHGTMSRINALEPELVITLHLTHTEAPRVGGMATVITPGYKTYKMAYQYVRADNTGRKKIRKRFAETRWNNWFVSDDRYKVFPSFMADAFIYYIGFWSRPDGVHTDYSRFRGYRHNLVDWSYADSDSTIESLYGQQGERYATTLAAFEPMGKFWEREKAEPEDWRREGGPEGFGGDNHYAGSEILRYTRKAFVVNGFDTQATAPKILRPYMSTWAVPTYTNAIAAFVELAHTTSKRDHNRMAKHRHIYAEAIAVAAYSLLYGMSDIGGPKGKKLPLERYQNLPGGNYFKQVKRK